MKPEYIVGVDTSNYTTSLAVATPKGEVVANLKAPLPVKTGECGLRQSDALFAHTKNLPQLAKSLHNVLAGGQVVAIGVSEKPRNQEGSYMPCFLAGISAAECAGGMLDVPVFRFSHQCGHLRAALYSAGQNDLRQRTFGAFHVSGGTTEMLRVSPGERGFTAGVVGGSRDLHAGQAIDRIGVMLGLSFPCGAALEALAEENTTPFSPRGTHTEDGYIHLSGLENLAQKLWQDTGCAACVADFTLDYLARAMLAMARFYRRTYGDEPLVFAGGVMADRRIQNRLRAELPETFFAAPALSTDNAAGTALLAAEAYMRQKEGGEANG